MERGSKFLAYAFPMATEEAFQLTLQSLRKEHPKARHFCTAFRLFPDASLERSNDDGEPSGSAGRPILGQIIRHHLTNTGIIVVRYFGGTKLGIPGLIEAYKTSAAHAIETASIIEKKVLVGWDITMPYEVFPSFLNFCKQNEIPVLKETYGETVSVILGLNKSSAENDLKALLQHFSGMDYKTLQEYAAHLRLTTQALPGDLIV